MPGIGKTQLGMQLAVNVQIPRVMGGAEGEAVYVDTEGSFLAERCYAIATALLAHLQRTAERDENPLHRAALQKLGDVKALLGGSTSSASTTPTSSCASASSTPSAPAGGEAARPRLPAFHPRRRPELRRADADARAGGAVATELAARHRVVAADEPGDDARQRRDGERAGGARARRRGPRVQRAGELEWRDGERHARLYKGAMSEAVPAVVTADGVREAEAGGGR